MSIGTSLFLIAVGAILRYAVTTHVSGINVHTAGLVLMIVGIVGLLLDRKGAHRPDAMPPYVAATLRNLAGLPHWVETWTAAHPS